MSSTIIVKHEICLSPEMCERLQEVFSPVSLYFPNGLKNRSIWQHRDTGNYIAAWYRLAEMRTNFITAGGVDADHRSPFEMEQIFNAYLEEIMSTLRPEQRNRPVVRYLAHTWSHTWESEWRPGLHGVRAPRLRLLHQLSIVRRPESLGVNHSMLCNAIRSVSASALSIVVPTLLQS